MIDIFNDFDLIDILKSLNWVYRYEGFGWTETFCGESVILVGKIGTDHGSCVLKF
jgi:hypothetical protein